MFIARTARFVGGFEVCGSVDDVFPLFSPQGEKRWVPGWNPEILHPGPGAWEEGLVFRTAEDRGEAVWVLTRLDVGRHAVEYHRVEPERYVVHVSVRCESFGDRSTRVSTGYSFVGLSEIGNRDIASMTQEDYDRKMARWSEWIDRHRGGADPSNDGI